LQRPSSQQGWPAPPQAEHFPVLSHERPDAVQKSAGFLLSPAAPGQQLWPAPPQDLAPTQLPAVHVPKSVTLQAPVVATHWPATQHEPARVQVSSAQHGCPVPPHVVDAPLKQTVVAPVG
jgi:hypothetical protein